jgi:hypothetical protein
MLFKDGGNRFDEYAYRIATRQVADATAYLEEGSWVMLDPDGKIKAADGSALAFLCLTSNRTSRDNLSPQAVWPKVSYLLGAYELTVQNSDKGDTAFDSGDTYTPGAPLIVKKDPTTAQGILALYVPFTITQATGAIVGNTPDQIVAYALGPVDDGKLRICVK